MKKKFRGELLPLVVAFETVTGQRISLCTLMRWISRGVRGVVLESWLVGGRRVTTTAAVEEFIEATTEAGRFRSSPATTARTIKQRREAIAKADEQLDEMGV